ncbi:MAG: hypothetical protein AAB353_07360 [Candidatus Hydrogenedentota bacterium]
MKKSLKETSRLFLADAQASEVLKRANGATPSDLTSLVGDALLGVLVIGTAMRSRDIWWIWCVHFAMGMTQFARVSGAGE